MPGLARTGAVPRLWRDRMHFSTVNAHRDDNSFLTIIYIFTGPYFVFYKLLDLTFFANNKKSIFVIQIKISFAKKLSILGAFSVFLLRSCNLFNK